MFRYAPDSQQWRRNQNLTRNEKPAGSGGIVESARSVSAADVSADARHLALTSPDPTNAQTQLGKYFKAKKALGSSSEICFWQWERTETKFDPNETFIWVALQPRCQMRSNKFLQFFKFQTSLAGEIWTPKFNYEGTSPVRKKFFRALPKFVYPFSTL